MSSHDVDSIYQDHHPDTENDLGELDGNHLPQDFSAHLTLSNPKMDNIGSTLPTTIKGTMLERIAPKRTFPGVIARLETVILSYWIYIAIVSIFLNIFAVYYVSKVKWTYHTYHTYRLYLAPHWIMHGVLVFVLMNDLVRSSSMSTREQQKVDYKVDRAMIPKLITIGILGTLEFWTMRDEAKFFKGVISLPKPLYYILETINLRFIITPCYQDFRQRLHQGSSSSSSRPSRSSKLLEIALIIAMVWCTVNRIMFVGSIDMCSDCLSRISWTDIFLTRRNIVSFAVPFVYLVMKRVISYYYYYSGEENTLQKDSNQPNLSILTVLIVTSFLIGVPYPEFLFLNFLLTNIGHPFFFLTPIIILSCLISLYSYHGPRTGRNIVITALLLSFIILILFLLF